LAKGERYLVTEHDDLDGKVRLVGPFQPEDLDGPAECEIEEGEGHGAFSRPHPLWRKPQLISLDEVVGTHRAELLRA